MPNFSELEIVLQKYFPDQLSGTQIALFQKAFEGYIEWNEKINVISRKDMENLAVRHFLYSLAIAKRIRLAPGTQVMDAGTGGGFPGIPLAIFFPECQFHLVDSRSKKITVVQEIVQLCGSDNVQISVQRVEDLNTQYDFVVSRAVAAMDKFIPWVRDSIHCENKNELNNGILYLRGGGVEEEMRKVKGQKGKWEMTAVTDYFDEPFFETKHLLYVDFCS